MSVIDSNFAKARHRYRWFITTVFIGMAVATLIAIDSKYQVTHLQDNRDWLLKWLLTTTIAVLCSLVREIIILQSDIERLETVGKEWFASRLQKYVSHVSHLRKHLDKLFHELDILSLGMIHARNEIQVFGLDKELLDDLMKESGGRGSIPDFHTTVFIEDSNDFKHALSTYTYRSLLKTQMDAATKGVLDVKRIYIFFGAEALHDDVLLEHRKELLQSNISVRIIPNTGRSDLFEGNDMVIFGWKCASLGKNFFASGKNGDAKYYFPGVSQETDVLITQLQNQFDKLWKDGVDWTIPGAQ